jgi:hypothetical protein
MKVCITLIVLSYSFLNLGQKNNGYYGRKAFMQIEFLGNNPLFYNLVSEEAETIGYKRIGNSISESNDKFNYGFRFSTGYAVKRNIGILFEFGQDFSTIYPKPNPLYYNTSYTPKIITHEMIDVTSTIFIPKVEFASAKSLLPMGLAHQFGLGFENSVIKQKDYLYVVQSSSSIDSIKLYSTSNSDLDPVDFNKLQSVRKLVVLYALSMRTPITKQMMIQYGIRYTLHLGNRNMKFNPDETSNETQMNNSQYTNYLMFITSRQRALSIINVNVGLTYAF